MRNDVITKYSTAPPEPLTSVANSDRTFTFLFSDSSVDLVGDSIDPHGIDTSRWETNPVILWSHNTDRVIARGSNLRIVNDALYGDVTFPQPGASQFADEVFNLVEAGFIKGISISFISVEADYAKDNERGNGKDYKRVLLLESSICGIPMNGHALIQEAKAKNLSIPALEIWFAEQHPPKVINRKAHKKPVTEELLLMTIAKVLKAAEKALAKIKKDAGDADLPADDKDDDEGMDEQTLSLHKAVAHLRAMKSLADAHDDHRDQLEECLSKAIDANDPDDTEDKDDAELQPQVDDKDDDERPEDDDEKAITRIRARVGLKH